jgi:hypothetical protein
MESQIENEQQLNDQSVLIEKIIQRLIHYVSYLLFFLIKKNVHGSVFKFDMYFSKDSVIIKLDKHGYKTADDNDNNPDALKDESDPILVVHPNYIPDE